MLLINLWISRKIVEKAKFFPLPTPVNPPLAAGLQNFPFPYNLPNKQAVMGTQLKKVLIIFAKRPVPGRVKTRLSPPLSPDQAAELYRCMLEDILAKTATLTGVDKRVFYEPDEDAAAFFSGIAAGMTCAPQKGNDLGERMANA